METGTVTEIGTAPRLDWARVLPWAQGRAAVLSALVRLELEAALAEGPGAQLSADHAAEIRRRVAAWDAETYQRAERLALRGL